MPFFKHDAIRFHYCQTGHGVPFVFQHGLGGSVDQPFGLFTPPAGIQLLALDCRCHGKTEPLGDPQRIGISAFADDLLVWLDRLQIPRAIIGGISLGAGVALNFTLRFPQRVIGLVQSRPAWLAEPNRRSAAWFAEMAGLIRKHGAKEGRVVFEQSATFLHLREESPDVANRSEPVRQSSRPGDGGCYRAVAERCTLHLFGAPGQDQRSDVVLANRHDPVHPFEYGRTIAEAVAGAEFFELTAKSISVERHQEDVQQLLEEFLLRHFVSQRQE